MVLRLLTAGINAIVSRWDTQRLSAAEVDAASVGSLGYQTQEMVLLLQILRNGLAVLSRSEWQGGGLTEDAKQLVLTPSVSEPASKESSPPIVAWLVDRATSLGRELMTAEPPPPPPMTTMSLTDPFAGGQKRVTNVNTWRTDAFLAIVSLLKSIAEASHTTSLAVGGESPTLPSDTTPDSAIGCLLQWCREVFEAELALVEVPAAAALGADAVSMAPCLGLDAACKAILKLLGGRDGGGGFRGSSETSRTPEALQRQVVDNGFIPMAFRLLEAESSRRSAPADDSGAVGGSDRQDILRHFLATLPRSGELVESETWALCCLTLDRLTASASGEKDSPVVEKGLVGALEGGLASLIKGKTKIADLMRHGVAVRMEKLLLAAATVASPQGAVDASGAVALALKALCGALPSLKSEADALSSKDTLEAMVAAMEGVRDASGGSLALSLAADQLATCLRCVTHSNMRS